MSNRHGYKVVAMGAEAFPLEVLKIV